MVCQEEGRMADCWKVAMLGVVAGAATLSVGVGAGAGVVVGAGGGAGVVAGA